jgi:filamentous hemagglutinin
MGTRKTGKTGFGVGAKPDVDWLKQSRHVPGSPGFVRGKSELLAPADELAPFLGKGQPIVPGKSFGQAGYRERVDFGVPIGIHRPTFGGPAELTSVGIVHYSKTGFHIVPGRPI